MINDQNQLPIVFLKHCDLPAAKEYANSTYDIVFITTGKCRIGYLASELVYTTGSICLIQPYTHYSIAKIESGSMIHMGINPQFVNENLPQCDTLFCDSVREPNNNYRIIKDLVSLISSKYLENPVKNRLAIHGNMFRMLSLFEEKYSHSALPSDLPPRYRDRILIILKYLNEHYTEPITLEDVAEELYLTPQYLSKFFKNCFNKNFKEYLSDKRLFHAHREICFTEDPITDIALRCGFSGINVFSKAFHSKYKMSPSQCRKNAKQTINREKSGEIDEIVTNRNYTETESQNSRQESFYKQYVTIRLDKNFPYNKKRCTLMNIGNIQNLLREDFQEDLLDAKNELGIKYVRIQGMTESSFIPKVQPDYRYYFYNLDRSLDFLHRSGLIPFIELSELAHSATSFNDIKTKFIQRNQSFFEALEKILEHISLSYPEKWTSLWKFELWYNPSDTEKIYTQDFAAIKSCIKRYLPKAAVGGCGFSSGLEDYVLKNMLEKLKSNKFSPDFISAHISLQTTSDTRINIISTKSDHLLSETKKLKRHIREYFSDLPFYITEWTSVFFSTLPIHYSCFQASFICRNVLALQPCCDMLGYWVLSQASSPYMTKNNSPYIWGQGLLDQNHIKMPAYRAFQFLNSLGEFQIECKENYCVTGDTRGGFQILVFNYAHITSENIFLHEEKTSFSDIYKIFESPLPSKIEFSISDVPEGTYKIEKILLSQGTVSILDRWIEGFIRGNIPETEYLINIFLPTSDNIVYYKNSCIPEISISYIKAENDLKLNTDIPPHNVCLWNITRQLP